jgi:hypothetical protein
MASHEGYKTDEISYLLDIYMPDDLLSTHGISKCETIIFGKEDLGHVKNQAQNYRLFVVKASIPSPTAPDTQTHAICLSIARDSKTIRYQDPLGSPMPAYIAEGIKDYFPDYSIIDHQISQQQIGTKDCGPVTIRNMLALAANERIPPSIDIQSIRSEDLKHLQPYRIEKETKAAESATQTRPHVKFTIQWNDLYTGR